MYSSRKKNVNTAGSMSAMSSNVVKNTPLQKSFAPFFDRAKRF